VRIDEMRNEYKIVVWKTQRKRPSRNVDVDLVTVLKWALETYGESLWAVLNYRCRVRWGLLKRQ
jgi:hypothetical protein